MSYIPKAGDTVYSISGEMALFVSTAKGGGYIVQPLFEDGDGVTEPESQYAEGVSIWPSVHKEPPQPLLDARIAEQEARLAMLRGEVRAIEQQKRALEADQRTMKDRFALHEQLTWIDDLLAGRFTHYVVKDGDYSDFWTVKTAEDFRKDRSGSQVRLQLYVSTHERGESFAWKVIQGSPGDRFDDKSRGVIPCKSEAEAIAKRNTLLQEALTKFSAAHHNAGAYQLRQAVQRCTVAGVEVPAAVLEDLRQRELREAQAAHTKAREALTVAEAELARLTTV